jgi:prolyl-tRNA editing enzyme YbaK/EbsC (Cys-tRNA(Pro) deacylase)
MTQTTFLDKLKKLGLNIEVKEFDVSTRTAAEAAAVIECDINQIAKSIVFNVEGEIVLVLVCGGNRVNEEKLSAHLGKTVKKADADFVKEKTGYTIGGVPPFGYETQPQTFIDEDLLNYKEVWSAAGANNTVFKTSPQELIKYSQGTVLDIK